MPNYGYDIMNCPTLFNDTNSILTNYTIFPAIAQDMANALYITQREGAASCVLNITDKEGYSTLVTRMGIGTYSAYASYFGIPLYNQTLFNATEQSLLLSNPYTAPIDFTETNITTSYYTDIYNNLLSHDISLNIIAQFSALRTSNPQAWGASIGMGVKVIKEYLTDQSANEYSMLADSGFVVGVRPEQIPLYRITNIFTRPTATLTFTGAASNITFVAEDTSIYQVRPFIS